MFSSVTINTVFESVNSENSLTISFEESVPKRILFGVQNRLFLNIYGDSESFIRLYLIAFVETSEVI